MDNINNNCDWFFDKAPQSADIGPNEPMAQNFKKSPYASLIREAIQNSLDVCLDQSKPVEMKFSIKSINCKNYPNFFHIKSHIEGCLKYYQNNINANQTYKPMIEYLNKVSTPGASLNFIQISDYNTLGMPYNPNTTDSPFYAFVQSVGVSAKNNDNAGGSFGFGKAAYFNISPIRTVLVSTKTSTGKYYFLGLASLCTHILEDSINEKYVNIGFYGTNKREPISVFDDIPKRFQRKDSEGNEYGSGTDINIMGVDLDSKSKEDIYNEMIVAVLRNFWLAIFDGKLIVTVGTTTISKDNLSEILIQYFENESDSGHIDNYNPRPYLETFALSNCDKNHRMYELDLGSKELGNNLNWGKIRFYLYKNKDANDRILFMRAPRMLVKQLRRHTKYGYYGVFLCDKGKMNTYLRMIENPSHTEWDIKNLENKTDKSLINWALDEINTFIQHSIDDFFSHKNSDTEIIFGIDQYLYIPTDVEDEDDSLSSESLNGQPNGEFNDDGSSITTIIKKQINIVNRENKTKMGKVLINSNKKSSSDPLGKLMSGRGNKPTKSLTPNPNPPAKDIKQRLKEDPIEGIEKNVFTEIGVHYRTFAQTINNKVYHNIIIHSDYDIKNGRIDLLVGGEDSNDKLEIVESDKGVPDGSSISNLVLKKGRNIIKIKFVDNMKHALKLEAYEVK